MCVYEKKLGQEKRLWENSNKDIKKNKPGTNWIAQINGLNTYIALPLHRVARQGVSVRPEISGLESEIPIIFWLESWYSS